MIDTVQFAGQHFNISSISQTWWHTLIIPAPEMSEGEEY